MNRKIFFIYFLKNKFFWIVVYICRFFKETLLEKMLVVGEFGYSGVGDLSVR